MTNESPTRQKGFHDYLRSLLLGLLLALILSQSQIPAIQAANITVNTTGDVVDTGGDDTITFTNLPGSPDTYILTGATLEDRSVSGDLDILNNMTLTGGVSYPGSSGIFTFTQTITPPNSFTLTHGISRTFSSVAPGSYTVTESDPDSTGFINTAQPGFIVIKKKTDPGGATESFTFTTNIIPSFVFSLTDDVSHFFANVAAATYTVTEDDPALAPGGFDLSGLTCNDANSTVDIGSRTATINVDPAESVTCVFTNTQRGTITIIKDATPADGTDFSFTTSSLGAFTLDDAVPDDVDAFIDTITFSNQVPGQYTITENDPSGDSFALTNIACNDGGSPTPSTVDTGTRTATINLDPGEDVTCTFSNAPLPGQIVIKKVTDPPGTGGTFTFTQTITLPNSFTLTHGISRTFSSVAPGSYTVTESDPDSTGFDLTGLACDDTNSIGNVGSRTASINVASGEIVTCVFTNTAQTGSITLIKSTQPVSSTNFTFSGDFGPFTLDDANPDDGDGFINTITFSNQIAGTYTVSEDSSGSGYSLSTITCDDSSSPTPSTGNTGTRTATINLDPDESVRCTFTNEFTNKRVFLPLILKNSS